jgi:serine/threonine-protein kinase HipA
VADTALPDDLIVLLDGRIAGTLTRAATAGSYTFTYDENWQRDPSAFPLSLSIPLSSLTHDGPRVSYYLRGLLPDNESRLNALAAEYKVDPDDPYALLSHVGEDCPGAVQFARSDRLSAIEGDGAQSVKWLTDIEVAEILRDLQSSDPDRSTANIGQFSLPGALAKVALTWNPKTRRWGRPSGRAATTHIIKPPLRRVKHHNENEHLCLELARAVGCDAASSSILRVEDQVAIVVERYDRERHGSIVRRLHQEDISQALGVNPRLKYANEGAPGTIEIVALLRDQSSEGIGDVYRFIRALAFNWVIGGTDAHPRNYSLLIGARSRIVLAPLYDLASAMLLSPQRDPSDLPFAMTIARRKTLGTIDRAAWEGEAKLLRLNPRRVIDEIAGLAERIRDAVRDVAGKATSTDVAESFAGRFSSRIRARAAGCLKDLRS